MAFERTPPSILAIAGPSVVGRDHYGVFNHSLPIPFSSIDHLFIGYGVICFITRTDFSIFFVCQKINPSLETRELEKINLTFGENLPEALLYSRKQKPIRQVLLNIFGIYSVLVSSD